MGGRERTLLRFVGLEVAECDEAECFAGLNCDNADDGLGWGQLLTNVLRYGSLPEQPEGRSSS
jgi:hypothetical protein